MRRLATVLAVAVLAACSGSGTSGTGGNGIYDTATGTMTATVDGAPFSANYVTRATLTGGTLSITGESFNGDVTTSRTITMAVANFVVDSTYTLSTPGDGHGGNALMSLNGVTWSSASQGGSGTLTIQSHTGGHIIGTFAFLGIRAGGASSTVTTGVFNIPF